MATKKTQTPKLVPEENEPEISSQELEELAELSGESSVKQSKYVVPILKFNGNKGQFTLLRQQKDGTLSAEPIGVEVSGTILKIRRVLMSFEKASGGDTISSYTNEHNSYKDEIILFERRKSDPKPSLIMEGTTKSIRDGFPNLRLKQQLYFLFNDEIVKLGVKGKGLSSLFNYYKEFAPSEHLFQFITDVSCHQEESEGGLVYYVMDFKKGAKTDLRKTGEAIREVAEALRLQDKSFQEYPKMEREFDKSGLSFPKDEDIPVIEEGEESPEKPSVKEEEEVKVENIPF